MRNNIGIADYTSSSQQSNVAIKNGEEKYMRAGSHIEIGSGFEVEHGGYATFEISDCECPSLCIPKLPEYFSPNCDGINDFYYIRVNGATSYSFEVYSERGSGVLYSSSGNINQSNNRLYLWNGIYSNGNLSGSGYVYRVRLVLDSECNGQSIELYQQVTVLDPDPCIVNLTFQKTASYNEVNNRISVVVWPTVLTINQSLSVGVYNFNQPYTVEIYNSQGQLFSKQTSLSETLQLDLLKLSAGVYSVVIKTSNEVLKKERIVIVQ